MHYAVMATKTFSKAREGARLLQVMIADAINDHTEVAIRRVDLLADECYFSERHIQKLILKQIGAGELVGRMDFSHDGGRWREFWIPIYEGEDGYDPQPCDSQSEGHICNGLHTPLTVSRYALYRSKADAVKAGWREQKEASRKQKRGLVHTVDNPESYPHRASHSSDDPANSSSHRASHSSDAANSSSDAANSSSRYIGSTHSYPVITQIDPGPSRTDKSLSLAELRTWAASEEGRAFIAGRGWRGDPAKATAGDVRDWHRAWSRLQQKGAAR